METITFHTRFRPIAWLVERRPCPPGTFLSEMVTERRADSGKALVVAFCPLYTYSLLPDSKRCMRCPLGGICKDGLWVGAVVNTSVWRVENDRMRVAECPVGFVLVRDEATPSRDNCSVCLDGTYNLHEPNLNTGYLVSKTPESAQDLCRKCPVGWVCTNGWDMHPIQIQV